ncbi:hypothetical protein J2S13_000605 [Oikeobacillus pervagus]|uniref:Spore germination protein n=1 Tax=Oikeobacillus pervagus TaxID=1325931 RepID=A0AAJ1T1H1_9BACI|nr:spore germination protein [Oikeobacillus pervagus]MDQ0214209.1 hypothetical protein [Oikeobacillus pervagus]
MVIVIAITAIASFSLPFYSLAMTYRILLFGFIIVASLLGLYGIVLGFIMLSIHLINLTSLGVPYGSPFAPLNVYDIGNFFFRGPIKTKYRRPGYLQTIDDYHTGER